MERNEDNIQTNQNKARGEARISNGRRKIKPNKQPKASQTNKPERIQESKREFVG